MNIELSRFSEGQLKSWREEIAAFIQENEKTTSTASKWVYCLCPNYKQGVIIYLVTIVIISFNEFIKRSFLYDACEHCIRAFYIVITYYKRYNFFS